MNYEKQAVFLKKKKKEKKNIYNRIRLLIPRVPRYTRVLSIL